MTGRVRATELLAAAQARLRKAGVATPRVDAELLLAHCLSVRRSQLPLVDVELADAIRFDHLVTRRVARVPLQHLTGSAPFRYVELAVGPGVFIPRPETELIVDAVLARLRAGEQPVVVDLCAGSGALAVAIADEVPAAHVYAVEPAPDALPWLRRNAGESVAVVDGDVRDAAVLAGLDGRVDVVVSNPPYVPLAAEVDVEVHHDPAVAVFAGADGLALMPAVVAAAARLLRRGGLVAIEHDDSHGEALPALLATDGRWDRIADHDDLAGRPRFTTAYRR